MIQSGIQLPDPSRVDVPGCSDMPKPNSAMDHLRLRHAQPYIRSRVGLCLVLSGGATYIPHTSLLEVHASTSASDEMFHLLTPLAPWIVLASRS